MRKFAVIIAAGLGIRMESQIPKQFLKIKNKPILVWSISRFLNFDSTINIVVVVPLSYLGMWLKVKDQYFPNIDIITAIGGETRTASVLAGLTEIKGKGLVAIHDAVRPFVNNEVIADCFSVAQEKGSGIAAIPLKDSIRVLKNDQSYAKDRNDFVLTQTPQVFQIHLIKKAYQLVEGQLFTDDAALYEAAGFYVALAQGSYTNFKITTPEDMKVHSSQLLQ